MREWLEQRAVRARDDLVLARVPAAHGNGLGASLQGLPAVGRADPVAVDLLDVDVLAVDPAGGETPGDVPRVAHHEVGRAGERRSEDVPAGRVQVDVEERVRDGMGLVRVHCEHGLAGCRQRPRHGPVVAAAEPRVGIDEADRPQVQVPQGFGQTTHFVGVLVREDGRMPAEPIDPVAGHDAPEEHLLRPGVSLEPVREAVTGGDVGPCEGPRGRADPGEFGRRRIERSDVGVETVEISVDDPVPFAVRDSEPSGGHVERSMQQVLPHKALAHDLGGVAVRVEARQVDLPQALVPLDVAHAAIRVGDRGGVDVRDAEAIVADLEGGVAAGDLDASIHG